MVDVVELFKVDEPVKVIPTVTRARSALLVLGDPPLQIVGDTCVKRPRETAHDVHLIGAAITSPR